MTGNFFPGNSINELSNLLSVGAAFEKFLVAFPIHETMDQSAARREFGKLTPTERETAILEADAYRRACTIQGRRLPKHAGTWLRDRDWLRSPSVVVQPAADPMHAVFVEQGSAEWDAWLAYRGVASFPTRVHPVTKVRGWDFPSRSPPGIAPCASMSPAQAALDFRCTDPPAPLPRAEA
jgi:hypothetical protein